jgi:glycosyltransferase involved in cell wall biosynthesis
MMNQKENLQPGRIETAVDGAGAGVQSIDVVIATYNAPPERLERSVRSGLALEGVRAVIVVDDGSRVPVDLEALERLSRSVRALRQENAGPGAARNAGLDRSTADLVIFVDDDDVLVAEGVGRMAELIRKLGASACVAARTHVWADGREEARQVPAEWVDQRLDSPSHVLRPIGLFGASGAMVTREVVERGVRFDTDLRLGEDRDFLYKAGSVRGIAVCSAIANRVAMHGGGANLSSPAHYAKRIRDHVVLLERYTDAIATKHMEAATRWLINAAAKAGVDGESWRVLTGAAKSRGWGVPIKARMRRMFRGRMKNG